MQSQLHWNEILRLLKLKFLILENILEDVIAANRIVLKNIVNAFKQELIVEIIASVWIVKIMMEMMNENEY